ESYIPRDAIIDDGTFGQPEISLVLYGLESAGTTIAATLQANNLFLQEPIYFDRDNFPYIHPQGYEPIKRSDIPVQPKARTQTKLSRDLEKMMPEVWKGAKTSFKAMIFSES